MAQIKTKEQYEVINERIEVLLKSASNEQKTPKHILEELDLLGTLVEEYEKIHYPATPPSIAEILRYKMAECNLSQLDVAKRLGISQSRISAYITGKTEPTLKVARLMCKELDISPSLILGI